MAALARVLQSVITRKYKFCCLCLKVINENTVNINDEVILKEDDNESAIKIIDVLTDILGFDVSIFTHWFLFFNSKPRFLTCRFFFIILNLSLVLTIKKKIVALLPKLYAYIHFK